MGRQIIGQEFTGKYLSRNPFKKLLIKHYFNTIYKTVKDLKISKVLEIGCGAGFSTQYITKIFPNMEASDWDYKSVAKARLRNPFITIRSETIYNLFRDINSFDLVIVLEVLEHLRMPLAALREVQRVGGRYVLFSVPNEPLWSLVHVCGDDPGHIWHWKGDDFINLISGYFTVIKRVTSFPWQIILAEK